MTQHVSDSFDDRHLQPNADAKVGNVIFSTVLSC